MIYTPHLAVIPVLIGPLQVLIALLPAILFALTSALVSLLRPAAMKAFLRLLWRLKFQLILITAVIAGAWILARRFPARSTSAERATRGADWPMFRGGPARTGAIPGVDGPAEAALNWTWKQKDEAFFSSPALLGNRLYVASANMGVFNRTGTIYAFDTTSGALAWQAVLPGYRATFSSPVVSGRYLVCGEGLHIVRDARIICLDLTPGREGQVLWTLRTASHVECAPVIADGKVFVGAGDDGYYCVALEPDANGKPKLLWHLSGSNYPDAETSLAVHGGRVYAGLGFGGRALCVLEADTGKELSRTPTPYPVFGPPSIAGGRLFVGMGNGDYVRTAEEILQIELAKKRDRGASESELEEIRRMYQPGGAVWGLTLADTKRVWEFRTDAAVLGAVAVADGRLYFGTRSGKIYCLDMDGRQLAMYDTHEPIIASVGVSRRYVYAVTTLGRLHCLDVQNLEPVWESRIGSGPLCVSSPAIDHDRLYLGTQLDGLLCVGRAAADRGIRTAWPGPLGGPGRAGNADSSPVAPGGQLLWQYPPEAQGAAGLRPVASPLAASEAGFAIAATRNAQPGLAWFPSSAAAQDAPTPAWFVATTNGIVNSPAIEGDRVCAVDGVAGNTGRALRVIDRNSGRVSMQTPVAPDASGVLVVQGGRAYVQQRAERLTCIDIKDGRTCWDLRIGTLAHAPDVGPAMILAAAESPASLLALDRSTGRILWKTAMPAPALASPVESLGELLLLTQSGLELRDLATGLTRKVFKAGAGSGGEIAVAGGSVSYINHKGELVTIARETGAIRYQPGAVPGLTPLPLGTDSTAYLGERDLMVLGPEGPRPWADVSWMGKPCASMVLKESRIYVPMEGWGMVCLGGER